MKELYGTSVTLADGELRRRENANRDYLMRLSSDNLLLNYRLEAARPTENFGALPQNIHGGWEFPTCQLRGHFLGHWLSAAAMRFHETGDMELKAKADAIVAELALCQRDNGGEWAASIPEKYFRFIGSGKQVWAPHYTVHKTFMGLVDMYRYAGNEQALGIADRFADWFLRYSGGFTREQFDDVLDFETGGMLEIWALLLGIFREREKHADLPGSKTEKYRTLLSRYRRGRLFDRLLAGEDPLTNMHANTTIPEVIGCAAAYEATGEERWREIVEAYWKCAVTDRGAYATGGQTFGEIWTPKQNLSARLGDRNQEHCTVYNMMRLAGFLLRWTKDPVYADYIERNLYNGVMAQAYWESSLGHGLDDGHPSRGLLTYFLPLRAGARKGWASETQDFFCCHGTVVQANAALNRNLYYQEGNELFVCQYFDSQAEFSAEGRRFTLVQREDRLSGSFHLSSASPERQSISGVTSEVPGHPDVKMIYLMIRTGDGGPARLKLTLRVPSWVCGEPVLTVNGLAAEPSARRDSAGAGMFGGSFLTLEREWEDGDTVGLLMRKEIRLEPLAGDETRAAFTYGPEVLAGLTDAEREIRVPAERPGSVLAHDGEREWGSWHDTFRTTGQETSVRFVPVREIGYEAYTVYFPIRQAPKGLFTGEKV